MSGEIHVDIELADIEVVESALQNQASASNEDGFQLTYEDRTLLKELEKEVKKLNRNIAEKQRVTKFKFRNVNVQEYFRPKMLSFGPVFADDPNLVKKELKLQLAARGIQNIDSGAALEEIKKNIKDMKKCFDEEVLTRYSDDEELARLLFLDGCAMLGYIYRYMAQMPDELSISNDQAALINQDLFLPENQIPFTVLEAIMSSFKGRRLGPFPIFIPRIHKTRLAEFVCQMTNNAFTRHFAPVKDVSRYLSISKQKPAHILDLLRFVFLWEIPVFEDVGTLICDIWTSCCGFVALVRYMMDFFSESDSFHGTDSRNSEPFCTVQELKTAGITFKPCYHLKTLSFRSCPFIIPKLMLPVLVLDESTEHTLLNLVAYEMCLPESHRSKELWVTSYVKLLDSLIENEQDLKDLKAAGILQNNVGSDTDAFRLIKSIGSKCFPPHKDVFGDMKKIINNYCRTRFVIWMAEVRNAHCRNPCTALAVLAATLVLVLTAVQTWYAINPKK